VAIIKSKLAGDIPELLTLAKTMCHNVTHEADIDPRVAPPYWSVGA
jgi:hypothetical protein